MAMEQNTLTVLLDIKQGKEGALEAVLAPMERKPKHSPFANSKTTHFARFVILNAIPPSPMRLYFSCTFDGSLEAYAGELVDLFGQRLN